MLAGDSDHHSDSLLARSVIASVIPLGGDIADDEPLDRLGLDSIGIVRVVVALEDATGHRVPADEVSSKTFADLRSLTALVARLRAAAGHGETT